MRRILSLILSVAVLFAMIPEVGFAADGIAVIGTNNGSATEIGAINSSKVSAVAPYQMSLLNSIASSSERLGGKEKTDSYINGDYYAYDGALFATPNFGANSSKRYRIYSFNVYGAAVQRAKVRFASNLKPVCADNISTNSNIRAAQWNNIVFVCDTQTLDTQTYINGVAAASSNVKDVIKSMGFTIAEDGMIYTSAGAAVVNISKCFTDVRFDVVKAGSYSFDDLTIAVSDTEPVIDAPAVLPAGDGYTIDGDVINLTSDSVQLPSVDGVTYVINGVEGASSVQAGDVVTLKKTTALGNLFTSYSAIDASNPLYEIVSLRNGLDGIENYYSTLETATFNGDACGLLKGVTQADGTRQMFLQYKNNDLGSADFVASTAFYANENIALVYFATSGHAKMGLFDKSHFVMNTWNVITLVAEGATGNNIAYINGVEVGRTTQPIMNGQFRLVVNTANQVLEGTDLYIDNFYVLKGKTTVPCAKVNLDTFGGREIVNVYGKTYQQIKDAIALPSGMRIEFEFGDTTPALTDKVKNGSRAIIYDRGIFVGDYTISFEQPVENILTSRDGLADTTVQKLYCEYSVGTLDGDDYAALTGTASTNSDHLFIQKTSSACEGDMILSLNIMPQDSTGSVYFATRQNAKLSPDVNISKLAKGEWNNLTLLMDGTSTENKLYVNGVYFGSFSGKIVDGAVRFIVRDTNVVGKKVYLDDFCIAKGKTEFPPITSKLNIDGLTINGYHGMTYEEIKNSLSLSKTSMTLSSFSLAGETVNALAEAQEGAKIAVYDNGVYITEYTLGTSKYTIGEYKSYSDGFPSDKFRTGKFSVIQPVSVYGDSPMNVMSVLALYDENNSLVDVSIQKKHILGTKDAEVSLDIEDSEGMYLSYLLWEAKSMRPVQKAVTFKPYSSTRAESIIKLYPGYTTKAATFSFDDGIVYDESTVAQLNKYGAKATFNLNGGRLMNNFKDSKYGTTEAEKLEFIKNLYAGHEIANHTYLHKSCALMEGETSTNSYGNTLYGISLQEALEDITINTAYIKEKLGAVTRGIAWPNGYPQRRTDYAQLKQGAIEDGHTYARNRENGSFDLPTDWMEWNATAHIKTATDTIDEFIAMDTVADMKVCFIWGHSYEFNDPERYGCGDFAAFGANLAKLAGENIWLATCGEIYDYVSAMEKLYETPYGVRNLSDMTLYANINGVNVEVAPGEEYYVDENMSSMPSVACWGDSLTYGQGASDRDTKSYPAVLSSLSGCPVYNMGVSGETTNTIAARQGVYDILISEDFTIPAGETEVEIKFHSSNGGVVTPRIAEAGGWTPCTINGITGTMRIVVDITANPRVLKNAYFTRNVPGAETKVAAGSKLIPYAQTVKADINVIFTGTNGGWTAQNTVSKNDEKAVRDFAALVREQAEFSNSGDKYVVIGLTNGYEDSWKLVNTILAEEFGDNFLDIKAYMLSEQAAIDAGVTLTDEDLTYISGGHIPQSYLTSDLTHFNDTGYALIAKALNEKFVELGYIE